MLLFKHHSLQATHKFLFKKIPVPIRRVMDSIKNTPKDSQGKLNLSMALKLFFSSQARNQYKPKK